MDAEMRRRMENVDLLWHSPTERAEEVWALLQAAWQREKGEPIPMWTLICFCAETLGKYALGFGNEALLMPVKAAVKWVYHAHYNNPKEIMGDPDKKMREDDDALQYE